MAKNSTKAGVIVAIVAIVVLGIVALVPFALSGGGGGAIPGTPAAQQQSDAVGALVDVTSCANDKASDLWLRGIDNNGPSKAHRNFTVLLQVETDSGKQLTQLDGISTSTTATVLSNALPCGKAAKGWFQHNNNGTNSIEPFDITADAARANPVRKDITGVSQFSTLQVRVFDLNNDGYLVANVSNAAATADITIAPGQIVNYTATGSNATGTTVGASGDYNVRIELKTIEADKLFGAPYGFLNALDTADDSNTNDFDEEQTAFIGTSGISCADVTTSWNANDRAALTTYELIYHCDGAIDDVGRETFELSLNAGDGVNPDFNPGMSLVHLGDFLSDDEDTVLTGVGFRDNGSTRTQLSPVQRLGFVII